MTTYPLVRAVGVTQPLEILGNKRRDLENGARYIVTMEVLWVFGATIKFCPYQTVLPGLT